MDKKKTLRATLDLVDRCGNFHDEVENLLAKFEELERAVNELFHELCPFADDDIDMDSWSLFRDKVINYCEGAK